MTKGKDKNEFAELDLFSVECELPAVKYEDRKTTVTIELHLETIQLLQRTRLLKSRFGQNFEQTLKSYLEMVASTVEYQIRQQTAEERRAEMHLVSDDQ